MKSIKGSRADATRTEGALCECKQEIRYPSSRCLHQMLSERQTDSGQNQRYDDGAVLDDMLLSLSLSRFLWVMLHNKNEAHPPVSFLADNGWVRQSKEYNIYINISYITFPQGRLALLARPPATLSVSINALLMSDLETSFYEN